MDLRSTKNVDNILRNDYVAAIIALFVILYGLTLSRVQIPKFIRNLFNNDIFRVIFLSLLLIHNFNRSPHVALAIALIFVITLHFIHVQEIKETFDYYESYTNNA